MRLHSGWDDEDHGYLGIRKHGGGGAPVGALLSVTGPSVLMSSLVAFLGRCRRRLLAYVAAWTPFALRGTVLLFREDTFEVKTTLSGRDRDPDFVAAVLNTEAGPSVVSEYPQSTGWRPPAWRAPTRTRIVDAARKALKPFARLPLTFHVNKKPMQLPFFVLRRLSVPLMMGCDFQHQCVKSILLQDGTIAWTTGAVSVILGYHFGARRRQYKAPLTPRVRSNALTMTGVTVLFPGPLPEVKRVARSIKRWLLEGRAEALAKHRLHLANGRPKKVRRH